MTNLKILDLDTRLIHLWTFLRLRPGFSHAQTRFINNHSFGEKLAKSTVYENKGFLISPSFCGPRHDSPNIIGWAITLIKACPDKLRTMLKDNALKTFGISVPSYPDPAKQTKDGNMINKQDKYLGQQNCQPMVLSHISMFYKH